MKVGEPNMFNESISIIKRDVLIYHDNSHQIAYFILFPL